MLSELLWTAPELLPASGVPGQGTLKGDVFSLGIILQEVLTRSPPYGSSGLSAEGTPHPSLPLIELPCAHEFWAYRETQAWSTSGAEFLQPRWSMLARVGTAKK